MVKNLDAVFGASKICQVCVLFKKPSTSTKERSSFWLRAKIC